MRLAIKQISAFYLATASGFGIGIALSQHPLLADCASKTAQFLETSGKQAAISAYYYITRPTAGLGWPETWRTEQNSAATSSPGAASTTVELEIAPFSVPAKHLAAHASPDAPPIKSARKQLSHNPLQSVQIATAGTTALHRHAPSRGSESVDDALDGIRSAAPAEANSRNEPQVDTNQDSLARELASRVAQQSLQLAPSATAASEPPSAASQSMVSIPIGPPATTDQIAVVERRLKDNLTPDMYDAFELFLYVSKAALGPVAQHMYVFEKQPSGDLSLAYNWPVSTGREKVEYNPAGRKLPSFTPTGYFELDPHRFYQSYWSHQWNEPMPYSMFFNWIRNGQKTGLAIHSAAGDEIGLLGKRASAGCIRLDPDAARTLFNLIQTKYRGLAPRFAINHRTGTMSRDGIVLHDPDGHMRLAEGYKVLVFIEDYGGQNVVAAIY